MPKCPSACYFEVTDLRYACELEAGHAGLHVTHGNHTKPFTWDDRSACVFTEMLGRNCWMLDGKEGSEELKFTMRDGSVFRFKHEQDCCENVSIAEVIGDLGDLVGAPLIEAEKVSSKNHPAPANADSFTWTFYKFATKKGSVVVRWLGTSNGYYSEDVRFEQELKTRTPEVDEPEWPSGPKIDASAQIAILDDEFERLDRLVH